MMSRRKKASEMKLAEYIAAGLTTTATEQTPTTWAAEWDGEERAEKASWWQRQWMAIETEGETA